MKVLRDAYLIAEGPEDHRPGDPARVTGVKLIEPPPERGYDKPVVAFEVIYEDGEVGYLPMYDAVVAFKEYIRAEEPNKTEVAR